MLPIETDSTMTLAETMTLLIRYRQKPSPPTLAREGEVGWKISSGGTAKAPTHALEGCQDGPNHHLHQSDQGEGAEPQE